MTTSQAAVNGGYTLRGVIAEYTLQGFLALEVPMAIPAGSPGFLSTGFTTDSHGRGSVFH